MSKGHKKKEKCINAIYSFYQTGQLVLPYLQANKRDFVCFTDSGKRQEALESEAKNCPLHSHSSMNIRLLALVPVSPHSPGVKRGPQEHCMSSWGASQLKDVELGNLGLLTSSKQLALCPRGRP